MEDRTRSGQLASVKHKSLKRFPNSTSDFRRIDIVTLNVEYKDAESINDLLFVQPDWDFDVCNDVYVENLGLPDIINLQERLASADIDNKAKTFVQLICDVAQNELVTISTEESRTDSLVCHLFERLGFNDYPLMIRHQPLFKFSIYNKEISSKYDFAIVRDRRVMLVDEDKHIKNTGPPSAWGEYQIAGELIAGAYCNYLSKRTYNETLYAVRVIGLRFTFYRAIISPEYLDSLGEGLPSTSVIIHRFPPDDKVQDFPSLNYDDVAPGAGYKSHTVFGGVSIGDKWEIYSYGLTDPEKDLCWTYYGKHTPLVVEDADAIVVFNVDKIRHMAEMIHTMLEQHTL